MEYRIQAGDTITDVTRRLGTNWDTLRKHNPQAIGKSAKTGDWIVKAGRSVSVPSQFQKILSEQTAGQTRPSPSIHPQAAIAVPDSSPAGDGMEKVHIVKRGETLWDLATKVYKVAPEKLMTFNNVTEPEKLRPGQELHIPASSSTAGREAKTAAQNVVAGWYGSFHQGKKMANGKPFNMHAPTIAHREIPIGTKVELENPRTGEKVKAVVTDRGPFHKGRDIDLSYGLAKRLSITEQGIAKLKMRVL